MSCLLKTTYGWYSALDNSELVGVVFIDLKKAFDTVYHSILCNKLRHYGVFGNELLWFKSCIYNRRHFCRVNGEDSKLSPINIGVPQGSCLDPLLFLVYINDLSLVVNQSSVAMFADDTSLSFRARNVHQLNDALNLDVASLDDWLMENKLSLNIKKTTAMKIASHRKNVEGDLDLKIRDMSLQTTQDNKYLGVQIDEHLTWKKHIDLISKKVSRATAMLRHVSNILPQSILKNLYTSIVEPHFHYCSSV